MTRHNEPDPSFDPRLSDWMEGDPDTAPGQVLETVLAAIPSIPQRRAMRLPRRPLTVNRFGYLAAAGAVVVIAVAALGAGGLLNSPTPTTLGSLPPPSPHASSPVASSSPVSIKPVAHNGLIAVTRGSDIALIDPVTGKTGKTFPVGPEGAGDLTWAPDGRRLAFTVTGVIRVLDVSDGTTRQIMSCRSGPDEYPCTIAWAPDGSRIAVAQGNTLELVDPDGSDLATVYVRKSVSGLGLTQPIWSPDGSRIAFRGGPQTGIQEGAWLYAVNRDGSDLTVLFGPVPGIGAFDPAWSPDGTTIAYFGSTDIRVCRDAAPSSCSDQWQLHVMSVELDGSAPRELREAGICYCIGGAPSLAWSPDGTSIVFNGFASDTFPGGLTVMNADGTGLRQLSDDGAGPAWQPVP